MAIEITVPRLGWSMEEGTFSGWLKQDGDSVKPGDLLFTLESDKTTQEIEALDSGILRIAPDAPEPGGPVKVGQVLGYLVPEGKSEPSSIASSPIAVADVATTKATSSRSAKSSVPQPPGASHPAAVPVTPRARRRAAELGVGLAAVRGSGRDGRIRERDVRVAAEHRDAVPPLPSESGEEMIPVTAIRRTIAARMLRSHQNTAPATLFCRVDATGLVALRTRLKSAGGNKPIPSCTDIVARIVALALQNHRMLAARWEGERIVLPRGIHLGIAVDTDHGLLVPVIRDVPKLSLSEFARRSRELITAARSGKIRPDDLTGGVFTLSNLGGFGIEAFTPIINTPETAVLGMGAIRRQPVILDDGRIAAREELILSLTFDHRVVDGAPAARFLQAVREGVEKCGGESIGLCTPPGQS